MLHTFVRRSMAKPLNGLIGAIGNTPLIRLQSLSKQTNCDILVKAEFMNPGGSVKDRAALGLIQVAERKGYVKEGATIVEGTAGNTGIGLAHVCRAKGYRCVIFMPDTQSIEKIELLRLLGAEVFPVPAVPYEDPNNYNHQAKRYAETRSNTYWTNQFDNAEGNRDFHYQTTGPEIWSQTGGRINAFTCASGTGGTLAGVTQYLKNQSNGRVKAYLADPPGSVLANYFNTKGEMTARTGSSITEGIGQGRVTENLREQMPTFDGAFTVPDSESIRLVYELLHTEGLYVGASSALNVAAAVEVANRLGPGKTIVTLICDAAYRYQSRLFSRKWLEAKGLIQDIPESLQKYIVLP